MKSWRFSRSRERSSEEIIEEKQIAEAKENVKFFSSKYDKIRHEIMERTDPLAQLEIDVNLLRAEIYLKEAQINLKNLEYSKLRKWYIPVIDKHISIVGSIAAFIAVFLLAAYLTELSDVNLTKNFITKFSFENAISLSIGAGLLPLIVLVAFNNRKREGQNAELNIKSS